MTCKGCPLYCLLCRGTLVSDCEYCNLTVPNVVFTVYSRNVGWHRGNNNIVLGICSLACGSGIFKVSINIKNKKNFR